MAMLWRRTAGQSPGQGQEDGGSKGRGKAGRKLSYTVKVQFNANLLVGEAYTAQLDLRAGNEFEIKLGCRQITLVPLGVSADAE